jgi:hypothetical protein
MKFRRQLSLLCLISAAYSTEAVGQTLGINCSAGTSAFTTTNPITWSHTVSSGNNRILIVGVSIRNNSSQTVSTITYGGTQSLAPVTGGAVNNATTVRSELWFLVAPTPGPANVVVTLSANGRAVGGAVSCLGVSQSTPFGTVVSGAGTGMPMVTVTSTNEGEAIIDNTAIQNSVLPTIGGGQTERWRLTTGGVGSVTGAGSTEPAPDGGGSVIMSWTSTAAWAQLAVAVKPAVVTAARWVGGRAALHAAGGVLVEWDAAWDPESLGYHVYRELDGSREQLTQELILTSTLTGRSQDSTGCGVPRYRWLDAEGTAASLYHIEEVDLYGSRRLRGPLTVQATSAEPCAQTVPLGAKPEQQPAGQGCEIQSHGRSSATFVLAFVLLCTLGLMRPRFLRSTRKDRL